LPHLLITYVHNSHPVIHPVSFALHYKINTSFTIYLAANGVTWM